MGVLNIDDDDDDDYGTHDALLNSVNSHGPTVNEQKENARFWIRI